MVNTGLVYKLSKHFAFVVADNIATCDVIQHAIVRHKTLILSTKCELNFDTEPKNTITQIHLSSEQPCEQYPSLDSNESYHITVPDVKNGTNAVVVSGGSVFAVVHALETLNQLVYATRGELFVRGCKIDDAPRFPHRGLSIDTARHFMPVPALLQNLELMAMNKLNVWHWHVVDDQSFPFVSKSFPELSARAAFTNKSTYAQEDVALLIEYARLRGIRTVVEFDMPGHTGAFGKAYPWLLINTDNKAARDPSVRDQSVCRCPMNVTSDRTMKFVHDFWSEIAATFPDQFVHIGGDEVDFKCCMNNPQLIAYVKENHISNPTLTNTFIERLDHMIKSMNKSRIVWQEAFESGANISPDTVIEMWKDWQFAYPHSTFKQLTAKNMRVVITGATTWYLGECAIADSILPRNVLDTIVPRCCQTTTTVSRSITDMIRTPTRKPMRSESSCWAARLVCGLKR